MKTQTIIFAFAILLCLSSIAQPGKNPGFRKQKMQSNKIAFITGYLKLTPDEAQKFWPVYNQYQNEITELKQNFQKKSGPKDSGPLLIEPKMNPEELSEKELEDGVMKEMGFSQKKLDLKKQYYSKFKEVLPVKKAAKLYDAERIFREEMEMKARNRHEKPRPPLQGDF